MRKPTLVRSVRAVSQNLVILAVLGCTACSSSSSSSQHTAGAAGDTGQASQTGEWCRHDDIGPDGIPYCPSGSPDAWRQCKDGLIMPGKGCINLPLTVDGNVFLCCRGGCDPDTATCP
jgi:hypothetical protein